MTPLTTIRIVMMQRDEGPMLMAWLSYYGRIFGFENLTIFDNGSHDPLTLHLLVQAERCGATVRRDRDDPSDFHGKGLHFAEQIRLWDDTEVYDFALPVDCDEFLVVIGDEGLSTSRDRILEEFASHLGEKRALRIGSSLFNIPRSLGGLHSTPRSSRACCLRAALLSSIMASTTRPPASPPVMP